MLAVAIGAVGVAVYCAFVCHSMKQKVDELYKAHAIATSTIAKATDEQINDLRARNGKLATHMQQMIDLCEATYQKKAS